jgi:NADPH:quinone reductase-like Zn-dependent oxidoreductase
VQKGESVLIHAAAGGIAAIQLAQCIGTAVFVTVVSSTKKEMLINRYGLPENHSLYSRDASFAQGIHCMTNDCGLGAIINSLSRKLIYPES